MWYLHKHLGVNGWAHLAWFIFVLTTIVVYVTAVGYTVAIRFIDSICSGVRLAGSWCTLDGTFTLCITGQEGLQRQQNWPTRIICCPYALILV